MRDEEWEMHCHSAGNDIGIIFKTIFSTFSSSILQFEKKCL